MFRNFYTEGRLSDGPPSSAPFGVASVGFDGQESSWIGLLSRPALSLLRKVRRWSAAPAELSNSFIGEEREILRQLNEIIPHHLSFTQCPHDGAAGQLEPGLASSVPWLSAVPVRHVGTELQPQVGYFSVRGLLGSQEAAGGKAWAVSPAGKSGPWWGSFLRRGDIQEEGAESQTCRPPEAESSGPPQQLNNADTVQNMAAGPGPEQDQGYHSLEEELTQRGARSPLTEEQQTQMEPVPEEPEAEEVLSAPQCGNKSIAFIMGLPCSDDDSSQSESGSDDDDDGFDSEGSSDLTSDEDEDDEASDSDSEPDRDSERLWSSFSHSVDPYNPQSFTASLHTGRCPRADPGPAQADPVPSHAASPPSSQDTWDDSASASEADEAESLRLLRSFSSSSDPYSPLNFQAPLRTRGPTGPPSRTRSRTSPQTGQQNLVAPPEYRREEAEERLDSGFAESAASNRSTKKVRFCDEVEEFFASCGEEEDRRGPWEELARDRCRFRRRCQEVEHSIGFCLAPAHRRRVYQGLSAPSDS
ncbi:protein phosphatase 1 regulatory subunit 15B-like [Xiphophorus hellerii]|uniref:protein phosphatase 1 regulatory subunit 15B-like n=1 Tax=Xiphophorus hellerii TaxID=8084 RepID=UPI0013B437F5|nr:protein phosphatase 1 regulatory subunit 15B-like [Xiphophorus hellerii]